MSKYSKIIDIEYPFSLNRKRMPIKERASIFSPFAALVGYEEAIKEKEIVYTEKIELSEESKYEINDILISLLNDKKEVILTYFLCLKENKGKYIQKVGSIKAIDDIEHKIILTDGTKINLDDLLSIKEN